jgi:hypothetical protein
MSRKEITPEESKKLVENAAGSIELTPNDLDAVAGGEAIENTEKIDTLGCCGGWTNPNTCIPCGDAI